MIVLSRRAWVIGAAAFGAVGVSGCAGAPQQRYADIDLTFRRAEVAFATPEPPGTIVIDPGQYYLYHVQGNGRALRYGVGVGSEGFGWAGTATVHEKQEWPDWYPTPETLARKPDILPRMKSLRGGLGMAGGPANPLGARALYLWQGNKDTLYRIHGTNEPETIGRNVSAGCIRMTNDDVIDLYGRTPVGTRVVVLPVRVG